MKKILLAVALAASSMVAHADEFTGDVKLSCEAILCLSTGVVPGACNPSLDRYFSITAKKMSDTISKRKDFLEICPTANADDNMRSLVNAIVNAAGRCDAGRLNATLVKTIQVWVCPNGNNNMNWSGQQNQSCYWEQKQVIDNHLPSYCVAYDANGYTYQVVTAKYVGAPETGGHWQ